MNTIKRVFLIAICFLLYTLVPVFGTQVTVYLNDTLLTCRQAPMIVNDRVLVPMRDIMEPLGYEVIWNATEQSIQATKNNTNIQLQIDTDYAIVNGNHIVLDAAPTIIHDITMVPLRFLTTYSGASVTWDTNTYTVNIDTDAKQTPTTADSAVYIQTNKMQGSGIILSSDGLIATNYHVIENASTAQIIFNNGTIYYDAITVVGLDPQADIALLKINRTDLHAATTSQQIETGASVLTISSGNGKRNTTTYGTIQGHNKDIISFSAPIQHGSSGGGLFLENGQLIGMCSAYSNTQYFAIPIQKVLSVPQNMALPLSSMKSYTYTPSAPRNLQYENKDGYFYLSWEPVYGADYYYIYIALTPDGPFQKMKNTTLQNEQWYWNFPYAFGVSLPYADVFYLRVASVSDGIICGTSETIKISSVP